MMPNQDVEISRCYDSITYYSAIYSKVKLECDKKECMNLLVSKNNSLLVRIIKKFYIELVDWRDSLSTVYDLFESNFVKCINWDLIDPKLINFYYDNLEIKNPIIYDSRCIPFGTFKKPVFPIQYTENLVNKLIEIDNKSQMFSYLLFPLCKEGNIKILEYFGNYHDEILKFAIYCSNKNIVKWILNYSDISNVIEEFRINCTEVSFDIFKILAKHIVDESRSLSTYINKCENADLRDRVEFLRSLE
jgi:hypothetical protein